MYEICARQNFFIIVNKNLLPKPPPPKEASQPRVLKFSYTVTAAAKEGTPAAPARGVSELSSVLDALHNVRTVFNAL